MLLLNWSLFWLRKELFQTGILFTQKLTSQALYHILTWTITHMLEKPCLFNTHTFQHHHNTSNSKKTRKHITKLIHCFVKCPRFTCWISRIFYTELTLYWTIYDRKWTIKSEVIEVSHPDVCFVTRYEWKQQN